MTSVILSVWVAAAVAYGEPQAGVFKSEAECRTAVATLEAAMDKDGAGDGDMISGCAELKLREPGTKI